jgi:hypothetical protein
MVIGKNISVILDVGFSRMISCVTLFRKVWVTEMTYILSSVGSNHALLVQVPVYANTLCSQKYFTFQLDCKGYKNNIFYLGENHE